MAHCEDEIKIMDFKRIVQEKMKELTDLERCYVDMEKSHESAQTLHQEMKLILQQVAVMAAECRHFCDEIGDMERKWMVKRCQLMF